MTLELDPKQVKHDTSDWLNRLRKIHKEIQKLYVDIMEVNESVD